MAETGWGVYVIYHNVLPTLICWWTCSQASRGDADIENRLADTGGEGEGGTNWESSTETYALRYVKFDSQWEFTVWRRELKSGALW